MNPIDESKHECMRGGTKDGKWYHTPTRDEERAAEEEEQRRAEILKDGWKTRPKGYYGPKPPPEIILGVTHLWLVGEQRFTPLYKCPLCHFQNIHKDVINHHIKFATDKYHNESGVII